MSANVDRKDAYVTVEARNCGECALSQFAGSSSQFCPFVIRRYEPGVELFRAGEQADYVWIVTAGVVGLAFIGDPLDDVDELVLPGGVVGRRCTVDGEYIATARTLTHARLCGAPPEAFGRWVDESAGTTPGKQACTKETACHVAAAPRRVRPLLAKRVTCPNSAHLEAITYTADENGMIEKLESCTAFKGRCAVECDQVCAERLNGRKQLEQAEHATTLDALPVRPAPWKR